MEVSQNQYIDSYIVTMFSMYDGVDQICKGGSESVCVQVGILPELNPIEKSGLFLTIRDREYCEFYSD